MLLSAYQDKNKHPIDTKKVYKDVLCDVTDIHIMQQNGIFFAEPDGLDAEFLRDVAMALEEC